MLSCQHFVVSIQVVDGNSTEVRKGQHLKALCRVSDKILVGDLELCETMTHLWLGKHLSHSLLSCVCCSYWIGHSQNPQVQCCTTTYIWCTAVCRTVAMHQAGMGSSSVVKNNGAIKTLHCSLPQNTSRLPPIILPDA